MASLISFPTTIAAPISWTFLAQYPSPHPTSNTAVPAAPAPAPAPAPAIM
eukprot:CAMPEP_0203691866 /NCGR_PEP_ID=MMETSP0091-20130426/4114_1 /ASSEMBLY_ACC=CAM_ASM_001089 /TAXON_ID=426623 /ORGANISM="Chaetoceros affinis, Strain CCMP159" /LENGTH=49 /DNA_ID= /DNA_START= /DNA_END= /DNA_ORIENTATION=